MAILVRSQEASSSMQQESTNYHVFLSFRGEDTRKSFTDHLYTALVEAGFRTFRDDDEIERGEEIRSELYSAIQKSRLSIIVFSKNYASSKWCLDELVMVLECKRSAGHLVLPVFLDVDPSDFRKQTGSLKKAFDGYEEMYEAVMDGQEKNDWMIRVNGWRAALTEVADLAGMLLQNQADGYESKFIQKVVKVIRDKVVRTVLNVDSYLSGVHSRAKSINLWLQDASSNIQILVICGIGGIGKSTIAKFVYNLNSHMFERSAYLANIREVSKESSGLLTLQKQLLSCISRGKKQKIYNIDEGTSKIKDAICCNRVFIVLDDVDDVNQLDILLGTRVFYPGSKIVITTRARWMLKAHEVHKLYMVDELDDGESLNLFSWYAFGEDHPKEGYFEQSKRVVQHCGGLPLALKVLGCSFSGWSLDLWESALQKLEVIPNAQVFGKLKISYDSLQDDHDKQMFLHIACFFVGGDKNYTTHILDKCDFFTNIGIQNLIDRCLLSIESNKLMMHQSIQEMGREIVRLESPQEPGKRTRLWNQKDSFNVVKEMTGTKRIEGLVLDMHTFFEDNNSVESSLDINLPRKRRFEEYQLSWQFVNQGRAELSTQAFSRMKNLKLLQLRYVHLAGCYEKFPTKLRWLSWLGFPMKSVPEDLPLWNLVSLDLRYSKLEQVWVRPTLLPSLKVLDLSYSEKLGRTPDLFGLPNLEQLFLKGCVSLIAICDSICYLERLLLLDLEDCKQLEMLPRNIHLLLSLETLVLSGCSKLAEFRYKGSRTDSLEELDVAEISINTSITSWSFRPPKNPETISLSLPHSLVRLHLVNCNLSEGSFPNATDLSKLISLKSLRLDKNPFKVLPNFVSNLTNLTRLTVMSCKTLQTITGMPDCVRRLSVGYCTSLETIMFEPTTRIFDISYHNTTLREVSGFFKLAPITTVASETLYEFGFINLESLREVKVKLQVDFPPKKLPVQMLDEFGISSTFIPVNHVPSDWFSAHVNYRRKSSSIAFTILPPSHSNREYCKNILGLKICTVYNATYKQPFFWFPNQPFIKIKNMTKNLTWIYGPKYYGVPQDEDLAWLSHWKFGNNHQFEVGDEVTVVVLVRHIDVVVKQLDINIVYEHETQEGDNDNMIVLSSDSNNTVISGNLRPFQLRNGAYFLYREAADHMDLTWQREVMEISKSEEMGYWTWTGSFMNNYNL